MRVIAVDWSGREARPHESIWLADVREGELVDLWNGRSRAELVEFLISARGDGDELVVGLDFAFSFPAWWCREQGWSSAVEGWEAMRRSGPELLRACEPPFWGRPGKRTPELDAQRPQYRRTELAHGAAAKSVFQIGGAGAVGTGSVRGMPYLGDLVRAGFNVWPFSAGLPSVVEIYPRELTGPVRKSRWRERHALLMSRFPEQRAELLERAAGSEDAFDAAVSALTMSRHQGSLNGTVPRLSEDEKLEGRIWRP